jgi:hypothetical protein
MHYKATLGNRHHRTADVLVKVADHNLNIDQFEMALALLDHALDVYSNSHHYVPEKLRASLKRSRALRGLAMDEPADQEFTECFNDYKMHIQKLLRDERPIPQDRRTREEDLTHEDVIEIIPFWSR